MNERNMTTVIQFRKSIALTLIGFLLPCLAQTARSNEATDGVDVTLPDVTQRYDFNGDGHPDYVLSDAQTAIWYLNNNVFLSGALVNRDIPCCGWSLVDAADFNGDGHPDYALFNRFERVTAIWYLNNNLFIRGAYGPTLPVGWALVAVGDFNLDGHPDYVLFNSNLNSLQTAIWYLNNNVLVSGGYGPTLPSGWQIAGTGDFNSDGHADYLLFNRSTLQTAIWYMSGRTRIGAVYGPTIASGYQLRGAADYNGDGHPDYVLFNPNTLQTQIWYLNNNVFMSAASGPTLPPEWRLVLP